MEAVVARPSQTTPAARVSLARLERMFVDHHRMIWRTLRRLGFSEDVSADMTQQAYLIAAEKLDAIRSGAERAFLYSTAIGLSRTRFRRERRCQLEADMDGEQEASPTSERMAGRLGAQQILDRILAESPTELVTVFVLHELEGLSSPEIAALEGIPVGTVASRLRRARSSFRSAARRMEISSRT